VCPFADAELAVTTLKEHGAQAKLVTYKGGHGWVPFTYCADRIKERNLVAQGIERGGITMKANQGAES
jgi:hypothetical protein